ncbi:hypothetical protein L6164_034923 [Bauhinia variegata]|uniref:Uncharacterized protein n=1 Tax=Bauhinia variegata TaxID=167791 RepID=A0ACB9KWS3_BAUVA|nr:hypothetical protein L6164_034923 [Bauhinia variegata]
MERISRVLVILGIVVVMGLAVATEVEGGRTILQSKEKVDHPENFVGGIAGVFPTPTGTSVGYCTFPVRPVRKEGTSTYHPQASKNLRKKLGTICLWCKKENYLICVKVGQSTARDEERKPHLRCFVFR